MGLNTIFGINGIGKDTIAEEIRRKNPEIRVTSMSRVYMYILGISKTCDVREKITEEQYKELESISQETMREIENNEYKHILERMANSKEKVIFLGHLISALRLGEDVKYLEDRKTPKWFVDINDNIIQLVAPAELISERRKKDNERKRKSDIEEILKHQELCSKEWKRISEEDDFIAQKMQTIENVDLEKTVKDIEDVIYGKNRINNNIVKEDEYGR